MAQVTSVLPRIFHWLFLVLEGLFALGAIALLAAMAINPHLPPGTHFGPAAIDFAGTPVRFPAPHDSMVHVMLPPGGFPFGSPLFFSGLLVLALSEVFRQGLALKRDSELTI